MKQLVLLGGPTGVGKSTTLRCLENQHPGLAVLDADDVWRVGEYLANADNRRIAIRNTVDVMRGYFEAGAEIGVLAWVFARPLLYEPVIEGLSAHVDLVQQVYLVAEPAVIADRLTARGDSDRYEYALTRLALIEQLAFPRIDVTRLEPNEVANQVMAMIESARSSG